MTKITGSSHNATDDISSILSCSIDELEDVLLERDITDVPWIEKPVIHLDDFQSLSPSDILGGLRRDVNTNDFDASIQLSSRSSESSSRSADVVVATMGQRSYSPAVARADLGQQAKFRDLIGQLICLAHGEVPAGTDHFDSTATFGSSAQDKALYSRRIGAAGEAYVRKMFRTEISSSD